MIYQIYPRSFQDSNGDGIGDLAGIIHRLPYVASLGVDAIWISPFFPSPMLDFGYDVMNYRDVDPMFGTLADFDALIAAGARARPPGDDRPRAQPHLRPAPLVPREPVEPRQPEGQLVRLGATRSPTAPPPNNWLSIFGGPAWEWDSERLQYYQHNFLKEQPDLNFHEPEVQDELLAVARFWLERGVDGFRLDTINFYFCDARAPRQPGAAARAARLFDGAGGQPLQLAGASLRQEPAGDDRLPAPASGR